MKYNFLFIIGLLIVSENSNSQAVLTKLEKDKRTKKDKEFILEIRESFTKTKDSLKVDFNNSDTLFIIRGLDIQSRTGYGYIWNKDLKIKFNDDKTYKDHKLLHSNPKIEVYIPNNVLWDDFNDLIPLIEKWDTTAIKDRKSVV
jgi:hypothetical protein